MSSPTKSVYHLKIELSAYFLVAVMEVEDIQYIIQSLLWLKEWTQVTCFLLVLL